jgi:GH25 family lysozyme M1 (1,4-beta-N-acetylmuramidase)
MPVTEQASALLLTLIAATPAAHAGTPTESPLRNHAMGSQIRLHDGVFNFNPAPIIDASSTVPGMDVSSYQGNVDWSTAYKNGARFAYIKATEGTYYTNSYFAQQYNGSYGVGMIRGAYHFANPADSSGATQAQYFVAHGGGWSADGKTLPGALDIEWDPYGSDCYGLSQSAMVSWINDFATTYHSLTTRWPVIYTATSWWSECTGTLANFSSTDPLWVARYSTSVGSLPYPWTVYSFWQYADSGTFPGDQNLFNGSMYRLRVLAK